MGIRSELVAAALALNREVDAETITYRRGAASVEITDAIPLGGIRPMGRVESGYVLASDELDWGIGQEVLLLDDEPIQPARGDLIEREIHGHTLTYTVLPDDEKQCWRWSDRGQSQYRIFTKLKSTT